MKEHKPGVLLIGGYGTGKTYLSRALRERCPQDKFKFATIANPRLTSLELLGELNSQLGGVSPLEKSSNKPDMLRALTHAFEDSYSRGVYSVIIVDEVQSIHEQGLLEELRVLLNIQRDTAILFTVLLLGQPAFMETIDQMPQFKQRLSVRYCLNPLNQDETMRYIRHRLEVAGHGQVKISGEEFIFHLLVHGVEQLLAEHGEGLLGSGGSLTSMVFRIYTAGQALAQRGA